MLKINFLIVLLFLLTINSSFADEEAKSEENYAVELTASNFDDAIKKNNHFVMFYAPWCGHCKRLKPLWEQVAKARNEVEEPSVIIAKVDCTQNQMLCGEHEITGYPTLRFFKIGELDSTKFKGSRDMAAINEFIKDQLHSQAQEKEAELENEEASNNVDDDDLPNEKESVYELTEKSFARHVSSGNHFVKFFAPWCSHCQRLAPTWEKLGESFKSEDHVSISKLDCTVYRPICQDFDVKGYPTLLWIENGKKIEKYSGGRDLDALQSYVKKHLNKQNIGQKPVEEKDTKPAAAADDNDEKLKPLQLTGQNFADTIEKGVVFIKFYAPWCGHCQQMSPTWDQLAAKLHAGETGIKVAKVDCTEAVNRGVCADQQVEGYPTIFAYKNGEKQSEYNGGRALNELQNYIMNLLGHTEL